MEFGDILRLLRVSRRMSQKELASAAQLDPSYISLLESGHREPATGTIKALAKALEVPVPLLLLFAAEQQDLDSMNEAVVAKVREQLMQILLESQRKPKRRSGGRKRHP